MQLERFAAVVEEGSVPDAALRVFRTQPAVSIDISKLEREFEAPLFEYREWRKGTGPKKATATWQQRPGATSCPDRDR